MSQPHTDMPLCSLQDDVMRLPGKAINRKQVAMIDGRLLDWREVVYQRVHSPRNPRIHLSLPILDVGELSACGES